MKKNKKVNEDLISTNINELNKNNNEELDNSKNINKNGIYKLNKKEIEKNMEINENHINTYVNGELNMNDIKYNNCVYKTNDEKICSLKKNKIINNEHENKDEMNRNNCKNIFLKNNVTEIEYVEMNENKEENIKMKEYVVTDINNINNTNIKNDINNLKLLENCNIINENKEENKEYNENNDSNNYINNNMKIIEETIKNDMNNKLMENTKETINIISEHTEHSATVLIKKCTDPNEIKNDYFNNTINSENMNDKNNQVEKNKINEFCENMYMDKNKIDKENINEYNLINNKEKNIEEEEEDMKKNKNENTCIKEKNIKNENNDNKILNEVIINETNIKNNVNLQNNENLNTNLLENETYKNVINNIINFHKNNPNLNLFKGEIYLNEHEYIITSYLLINNGFRFFPIEDFTKKKRKDSFIPSCTFSEEKKRTKIKKIEQTHEINENSLQNMNKYNLHESGHINKGSIKHDTIKKIENQNELTKAEYLQKNNEDNYMNDKNEEKKNIQNNIKDEKRLKNKSNEINEIENEEDEKERIYFFEDFISTLHNNNIYNEIKIVESNFKNLNNTVENKNAFYFSCIFEKIKKKKYQNVLFLYKDIYKYFNHLLYLSKPSTYQWLKLHELSSKVTNIIYNIQQKRQYKRRIKKKKKEKNNHPINEQEKIAFQTLLTQLHQDVHFELFRKFKNKAVWKTLDGGEIELEDKLTKAHIFREMYEWCKMQKEQIDKKHSSESDSSKYSY